MVQPQALRDVEDAVLEHKILLLYFTRADCAECYGLDRRMARLSRRYPRVKFFQLSLDKMPYAGSRYLVYEVPTALLYYRGKPTVKRVGGLDIKELSDLISQLHERDNQQARTPQADNDTGT